MPLTRIKLTAIADGGITAVKLANPLNLSSLDVTLPQGVGGTNWTNAVQTSSFTAVSSNGYFVDTTLGVVTVTLPASPSVGNYVSLVDYAGTNSRTGTDANGFYTNRIQINPNGSKINGSTDYKDIGASRGGVQLVYVDSTQGWIVTDAANENTVKALLPSTPTINVGGILNANSQAYFQDTNDPIAGRTMTVQGTGFMEGVFVEMIDVNDVSYTATTTYVSSNQITFVVPDSAITAAIASNALFDDRFDVKVNNSNGSFVIVSDAIQYAPRPYFALPADTLLGTVSDPSNTTNNGANSFDSFTTLTNATITADSLDADDTITYAITDNGGLTNLSIDPSSGALSGTQTVFPSADTLQEYTIEITATATTSGSEDSSQPQVTFPINYKILVEGAVSAPTVSSVELGIVAGDNYFSAAGNSLTVTGTGFANKPVVVVKAADGTEYTIDANDVTYSSPIAISFLTTADMVTKGQVSGGDPFDIKVTNPNTRTNPSTVPGSLVSTGAYEKTSGFVNDLFEYFGNAPSISPTSTNIGSLSAGATGAVDYTTLTTTSFTITTLDPDDTIQSASISSNSNLPGLGVSITSNTPSSKVVTLTGTNSSDITTAGDYTFNLDIVTESDQGGVTRTASTNQQYTVTIASASASFYNYPIEQSLRFDGSSYLSNRTTQSTPNDVRYTISMWIKGMSGSPRNDLFGVGGDTEFTFYQPDGDFYWYGSGGNAYYLPPKQKFRDTSSWYHLVFLWDSNNNNTTERMKMWVNGEQVTDLHSSYRYPNTGLNSGYNVQSLQIGYRIQHFEGYMADIYLLDGIAEDANSFGETISDIWVPKQYGSGDPANATTEYGTNGFHLDFSPASIVYNGTTITQINDVSGNNNHWAAN